MLIETQGIDLAIASEGGPEASGRNFSKASRADGDKSTAPPRPVRDRILDAQFVTTPVVERYSRQLQSSPSIEIAADALFIVLRELRGRTRNRMLLAGGEEPLAAADDVRPERHIGVETIEKTRMRPEFVPVYERRHRRIQSSPPRA